MSAPVTILHIFGRMNRGGAEMRTLDMMRLLDRDRFRLHFCTLSGLPGDLDHEILSLGGVVHPCRLDPGFPRRFRRLIREVRPEVVHSHVLHASGYMLRLSAAEGVPIRIAHFRSTGDGRQPSLRRQIQGSVMRRWLNRYATDILAVSHGAMREAWTRYYPADERCKVIYTGIDTAPFAADVDPIVVKREFAIPASSRTYIHVGNFTLEKNHRKLVRIWAELVKMDPDAHLIMVGRGGTPTELQARQMVEQLGLSGSVHFTGSRIDVPKLLRSADTMIFPSLREGLPGVVLESCAAGTSVVASDLPGVVEIAAHFSSVVPKPATATDLDWAETACQLAKMARNRVEALRVYRTSPFSIDRAIELHEAVWAGKAGADHG